jgi:hypothetical protein
MFSDTSHNYTNKLFVMDFLIWKGKGKEEDNGTMD